MRRTRWDVKGDQEEDKEESHHWDGHRDPRLEWNMRENDSTHPPGTTPPLHHRRSATPSPLDYRSESRRRAHHDTRDDVGHGTSHGPSSILGHPPYPHNWTLMSNPLLFGGTSRSHHVTSAFSPQHPGYYQGTGGVGQFSFDLKWWGQQKQSVDSYLGGPSGWQEADDRHRNPNVPQWSIGNRVMKNFPRWQQTSNDSPHHSRDNHHGHDSHQSVNDRPNSDRLHSQSTQRNQETPNGADNNNHDLSWIRWRNVVQRQGSVGHNRANTTGRISANRTPLGAVQKYGTGNDPRRRPVSASRFDNRNRELSVDGRRRHSVDLRDIGAPGSDLRIWEQWRGQVASEVITRQSETRVRGSRGGKKINKSRTTNGKLLPNSGKEKQLIAPSIATSNAAFKQAKLKWMEKNNSLGNKKGKQSKSVEALTPAESAKKIALSSAANKLKMNFLAAKLKNGKGESSSTEANAENQESVAHENDEEDAQDLSLPRRKGHTNHEYDIHDIRFSSDEWAQVGRGRGGVIPSSPRPISRKNLPGTSQQKDCNNSADGEEQEDSGTYSDTDAVTSSHWTPIVPNLPSVSNIIRRRHMSESSGVIDLRKRPISIKPTIRPGPGRMRSCSMSQVEGNKDDQDNHDVGASGKNTKGKLNQMPRWRRRMLKQLLIMDKRSLQELVDNPRSRKAQFMMSNLMSEHREALSQRLTQLRFKNIQDLPEDELQFLQSLDSNQLNSLAPDVLQQVREILAMEHSGDSLLEEASMSLNDLLVADCESDECQIVSPPPRDPCSTITIHDSDSEMEEEVDDDHKDTPESSTALHDGEHLDESPVTPSDDHIREVQTPHEHLLEQGEDEHRSHSQVEILTSLQKSLSTRSSQVILPTLSLQSSRPIHSPHSIANAHEPTHTSQSRNSIQSPHSPEPDSLPIGSNLPHLPHSAGANANGLLLPPAVSASVRDHELEDVVMCGVDHPPQSALHPPPPTSGTLPTNTNNRPLPGPSNLLLTTPALKVKDERPSPVDECWQCINHTPRSPHTSECYGLIRPHSPVPIMPGPPGPLGDTAQRPVPRIPTLPRAPLPSGVVPHRPLPLFQRAIKQEKLDESYLKFEHVKRPSSEERPGNPPPQESSSPLLPMRQPLTLHPPPPPPRPLIFSPDNTLPEPPRPPPPPPPQFSPRIKFERHTPVQFMCCCMRNECERSSNQSAEMRPPSQRGMVTPQPSERRATPHMYKMEPPSPCASRARTPHHPFGFFAAPSSPRCVGSASMNIPVPSPKPSIILQNDKDKHSIFDGNSSKRQFIPNLSHARSITPSSNNKVHQSTNTEDSIDPSLNSSQRIKGRGKSSWQRGSRPRNYLNQLTTISNSLNNFEFSQESGVALQQMLVFSEQEAEFVRHLENLDQDIHEMLREKQRMREELSRIQQIRMEKMQNLIKQANGGVLPTQSIAVHRDSSGSDVSETMDDNAGPSRDHSEPPRYDRPPMEDFCVQSTTDNAESTSVVSSSQEKATRARSFSLSHTSSNESSNESQSVRRQRCTSTCRSPVRPKSKEYTGSLNPNQAFYGEFAGHKADLSNTDSETDNDFKPSGASSPHKGQEVSSHSSKCRPRNNSISSSAEGDIESEVPAEQDDENHHRLKRAVKNEGCHAIVDSSQRFDNSMQEAEISLSVQESDYESDKVPEEKDQGNIRKIFKTEEEKNLCKVENEILHSPSRKSSTSSASSPDRPKSRNSSGEHCYSLRSRGPPSESQGDPEDESQPQIKYETERIKVEGETEDERDKEMEEDDLDNSNETEGPEDSNLSEKKRKRKRKTKRHHYNKRKKKRTPEKNNGSSKSSIGDSPSKRRSSFSIHSPGVSRQSIRTRLRSRSEDETMESDDSISIDSFCYNTPPSHTGAITDIKVIGDYILTGSSDGTARCYDVVSGQIMATYAGHSDQVNCIDIMGKPNFSPDSEDFTVVTASRRLISLFYGKSGELKMRKEVGSVVRCLVLAWGHVFVGTEGGAGVKWNLKEKNLSEVVQYSESAVSSLKATTEGSRRMLLVAVKSAPLTLRDAMTGFCLRTLEHVQDTVYSVVFSSGLLYTGGSNSTIAVYDAAGGANKGIIECQSDVSSLTVRKGCIIATCCDGFVRIFSTDCGDLLQCISLEASNKKLICSTIYKDKLVIGTKTGDVLSCQLPSHKQFKCSAN